MAIARIVVGERACPSLYASLQALEVPERIRERVVDFMRDSRDQHAKRRESFAARDPSFEATARREVAGHHQHTASSLIFDERGGQLGEHLARRSLPESHVDGLPGIAFGQLREAESQRFPLYHLAKERRVGASGELLPGVVGIQDLFAG